MNTTIKNTIATICGTLACVAVFAAVSVKDGSAHEMAVRCGGIVLFALFGLAWAKLKEDEQ